MPEQLMKKSDLAKLLGVSIWTIDSWRRRYPEFMAANCICQQWGHSRVLIFYSREQARRIAVYFGKKVPQPCHS